MKNPLFLFLTLLTGLLMARQPAAEALLLTEILTFPSGTSAVDNFSGNGEDFRYLHSFPETLHPDLHLLSASLKLTHSGNVNEGPTREIWHVLSPAGSLIGILSASGSSPLTDSWELPAPVLDEVRTSAFWQLEIILSERTPFNSEKVDLIRSELEWRYEEISRKVVETPEPGSAMLFGIALLFRTLQKRRRDGNRCSSPGDLVTL